MPVIGETKNGTEIGKQGGVSYQWHACGNCGEERWVALRHGKLRSNRCQPCGISAPETRAKTSQRQKGVRIEKGKGWHGGQYVGKMGYKSILVRPEDPCHSMMRSDGYVFEHRLVMARYLGRCLHPWEIVHHKNGVRADNRIENLELSMAGSHAILHNKGYSDGFSKGYQDGRDKQIKELRQRIAELTIRKAKE